ncbi:SDR family NAD(P)-dependent oxidoreductase [Aquiflexum sp.]|uniref:SDR family NAD(P)-dependent oxidoreductase n=1 Tax=Aquiflexum sp. TaxID=1872584 RepID=UPI0035944FAB
MKHFALITGASEGLGKSLALECANKGMDILLVSLPSTGLPELKLLLDQNFEVFVDYLEIDLTDDESCHYLIEYVKSKEYPISFLINNAGVGGNYQFGNQDFAVFNRMIQLNIKALTMITHGMINVLAKNSQSFILNVSSMIIHFEGPYKQVYGATKSFIFYFSKSLSIELKDKNIQVTVLCPGGINSNIKMARINNQCNLLQQISVLYPEEVAAYSIEKTMKGKNVIIPGKIVNLYFIFSKLLPNQFRNWLIKTNNTKLIKSQQALSQ